VEEAKKETEETKNRSNKRNKRNKRNSVMPYNREVLKVEYRLAEISDTDDVFALIKAAIVRMEADGIHQWDSIYPTKEDFKNDIDNKTLYLAIDESKLAAIYVISGESDEAYKNAKWQYSEENAYILHRFCVSPDYQNQGIGKAVLTHIETQIGKMGYESVRLDVFTENPYAQRLYRKSGYKVTGYADWRKGRFDLMEKKLE